MSPRPRVGTVVARVQAALMLVVYGIAPLAFAVDMGIDRAPAPPPTCRRSWTPKTRPITTPGHLSTSA
ncbi:hypothetical protein [Microbispora siamensis]|uniref:hypothetical protein n=1 Tax=Microbispora siamensis TaxID=564413 RepID=UPI00194F9EBE|nr:hypothetical protein [Microbispora siamensis]